MECPHLEESAHITAPPLDVTTENSPQKFTCSVCRTDQSPWICLKCGVVNCGRYISGHAKLHHEMSSHPVCMDCDNYATFCYVCDEFVINDTKASHLDQLRKNLQSPTAVISDAQYPNPVMVMPQISPRLSSESQENEWQNNHRPSSESQENDRKISCRPSSESQENDRKISCRPASESQENDRKISCRPSSESQENDRKISRRPSSESQENDRKRLKKEDRLKTRSKSSGLRNLGNTCFMNAVLQSLSNIQEFCGYIKKLPSLDEKPPSKAKRVSHRKSRNTEDVLLVEELRKTLIALWQGSKTAISPESLFSVIWKVVPRFRGYQQQDAHEFMRYLLDRLHTELLSLLPYPNSNSPFIGPKGRSTIVTAIFGGLLQNEVMCLICGMESKKHDPFLDLSLDIPLQFHTKGPKNKDSVQPMCRLSDCLSSFTDTEELEESELYMCSNCKKKQRSTKKFWIRRLPNVLCLHLKRFRWQSCYRVKVETFIEFPLRALDMNRYVLNNLHETRGSSGGSNLYDLAAVIVHHGSGAGSGHYTSYAVHEDTWYHFNDSTVTACDIDTVARCKAYILFYVRREIKLPDYLAGQDNGH